MVELYGVETNLAWSDIAMTVYILLNLLLLFLLMLCTCRCKLRCSEWCSGLWERRGIYSPVILQFLDQTTDIGVIILWLELVLEERSNDEFEVDHVSVTLFFGLSVISYGIYRIAIIILACVADNYDQKRCIPLFLSFFDLIFLYEVQFVQSNPEIDELSEAMRNYQVLQCMFESVPQVVFQSVFVLRTWPNRRDFGDGFSELLSNHEYLLLTSIVIAVLNICNKYTWRDQHVPWVERDARLFATEGKLRFWFLHVLWRFVHVLGRLILIVLMWSVLGGAVLSVFWFVVFILFMLLYAKYEYDDSVQQEWGVSPSCRDVVFSGLKVFVFEHVIGMTSDQSPSRKLLGFRMSFRLCEYIFCIGLVWAAIQYRDSFTCPKYICASKDNRDIDENPMLEVYLFIEMGSLVLDFVFFVLMWSLDLVVENSGHGARAQGGASAAGYGAPGKGNENDLDQRRASVGVPEISAAAADSNGSTQQPMNGMNGMNGQTGLSAYAQNAGAGGNGYESGQDFGMTEMAQMGAQLAEDEMNSGNGGNNEMNAMNGGGYNDNNNNVNHNNYNDNDMDTSVNSGNDENNGMANGKSFNVDVDALLNNMDMEPELPDDRRDMQRNMSNEDMPPERVHSVDN